MKWCTTVGPVLHPGRCCGTPLCGEPAVRGRGRRDAVATGASIEHGCLHHAHASVHLLQYDIYRMDDSGKPSVHRHPRLKGEYTSVRPFCANRFATNLQPTLPPSHCAKCAEETVPEMEEGGKGDISHSLCGLNRNTTARQSRLRCHSHHHWYQPSSSSAPRQYAHLSIGIPLIVKP